MFPVVLFDFPDIPQKISECHAVLLHFDAHLFCNILIIINHIVITLDIRTYYDASGLISVNRIVYDEGFLCFLKTLYILEIHEVFFAPPRIAQFFCSILVYDIIYPDNIPFHVASRYHPRNISACFLSAAHAHYLLGVFEIDGYIRIH